MRTHKTNNMKTIKPKKPRENTVENYLVTRAAQEGFLCPKFKSASNNGVTDRILIGHDLVLFVETKRPGEKPRPLQRAVIQNFKNHGADTRVIDTKAMVDELFDELRPWCETHPNNDAPPDGMPVVDI